jgi:hypothetical protein
LTSGGSLNLDKYFYYAFRPEINYKKNKIIYKDLDPHEWIYQKSIIWFFPNYSTVNRFLPTLLGAPLALSWPQMVMERPNWLIP